MGWFWKRTETEKSAALRLANRWEKRSLDLLRRILIAKEDTQILIRVMKKLEELAKNAMEESQVLMGRVDSLVKNSEELERQHSEALDALRSELTVLNESTIPVLVASNQLHLERYRSETAVQVMRQVAASGGIGDKEE